MSSRRRFLGTAAAFVLGCRYSAPSDVGAAGDDSGAPPPRDTGATPPGDSGTTGADDTGGAPVDDSGTTGPVDTGPTSCVETSEGAIGPNYLPNAPEREELVPASTGGTRLEVSGWVRDTACAPVPDARIEVWQAELDGGYDFSEEMLFRGTVAVDADGAYRFITRVPGYELGPDGAAIPLHIHLRVAATGTTAELVTLLYFSDDGVLAAFDPPADLVGNVESDGAGGKRIRFDLVLPPA